MNPSKKINNNDIGNIGEDYSVLFLKRRGYRILTRNKKTPIGEIDIICSHRGILVFVEVKTLISERFGPPKISVDKRKRKKLILNALYYLKKHIPENIRARIDVVEVTLSMNMKYYRLSHLRNAVDLDILQDDLY